MIADYYRAGHGKEELTLFNQMQGTCILPNQFTLFSLLPACTHLEVVAEVHEEIIRSVFQSKVCFGECPSLHVCKIWEDQHCTLCV